MSLWTLAIDQGSHASRALLFDADGDLRAQCERPVGLIRGDQGRVEQDAGELLEATRAVLVEAREQASAQGAEIGAAGLATQRSTLVLWDAVSAEPLMPALHWQDTRFAADVEAMDCDPERIRQITGLGLSAHYGAPRLHGLLSRNAELRQRLREQRLRCAPLASFLLQTLRAGDRYEIDACNASRMGVLDLRELQWSDELLKLFGLPRRCLPVCRPVEWDYGSLSGTGIALRAVSGDQNAALFCAGLPPDDVAMVNLGSGAFVSALCGAELPAPGPLLAGLASAGAESRLYLLEGTVNGGATALHWAAGQLGCEVDFAALEQLPPLRGDGPVFINRVGGLGSPWWRPEARSYWRDGAGAETQPEAGEALWAVLESILFMICANLLWLRRIRPGIRRLRVGGGLARMDRLCQTLATLSGLPVQRLRVTEASARGIAWLAAGRPAGWHRVPTHWFEPGMDAALLARYSRFLQVVDRL